MLATSQKFKLGSTERELDLVPSRVPHELPFIYVDDVLEAFEIPHAVRFEAHERTIAYVRDDNGKIYDPKRIPCRPDCVIQVVYKTPQSDLTLESTIAPGTPVSLNESVDQLSIKGKVSTGLDSPKPLRFGLSRKSTMQIQEDMKVMTDVMVARNRAGKSLDAYSIIEESLPAEYHASVVTHVIINSEFESRVMEDLKEIRKDVKEGLELSKQTNDRLILIQSKTEAILTQQLELAEYPIPRLFIVLPEEPVKYDPGNWFRTKFRLHFICECGEHTKANNNKVPHHLHLAKHEGYLIREPTEFFKKYGPFLLLMLELIKFGTSIAGHAVPTLASLKAVELVDSAKQTVELVAAKIDYSLECINKQLAKAQASSPGDFIDTEPRATTTQQDLTNYLGDVEGLEGVELRQLGSFLKTSEEENLLGNLYRMTTSAGHVKWVCRDHYRASYLEMHTQKLRDMVKLAKGEFDEQLGRVTITLKSSFTAAEFYNAVIKAKGVLELVIYLSWECTRSDLQVLEDALKKSRVSILRLDLRQFQTSLGSKLLSTSAQCEILIRIIECPHMKTIHMVLPKEFIKLLNFQPITPPHLLKLSFELMAESIGGKSFGRLAEALKTNSTLTTLDLMRNSIGDTGAQALAEALKTNSTLIALDLQNNSIGDSGAQALAEALETNSTLTTLELKVNSIGDIGAKALAQALKINLSLTTLDLRRNKIWYKGLLEFSEAFKSNSTLAALYLQDNLFKNKVAQALSEVLKTNSTLTTLNLWASSIGDSGAQALAEALKTNSTLITLNLRHNSIGENGALALSEALKTNSTLTTLNLRHNSIGENGALALSEALKSNSTLTTLNFELNSIGENGAQALSEALKTNSTLTTLDLQGNLIGENGAQELSEALKNNSALTTLNLELNSIGENGAQALSEALKINSTLTIWIRDLV
ncbi:hypothetical protein BG000_008716 [Podila horticola]|nr:hypothetical protein BG000_008716 [Podila horticola]